MGQILNRCSLCNDNALYRLEPCGHKFCYTCYEAYVDDAMENLNPMYSTALFVPGCPECHNAVSGKHRV